MKRIAFIFLFCVLTLMAHAQFFGGFNIENDGHIYFKCQNQSGYNLTVQVVAQSSDSNNSEYQTVGNGGGLILGPTTPWRWFFKKGDIVQIIYANGQSQYWSCPQTDISYNQTNNSDNPSFKNHGPSYGKCPNSNTKWNPTTRNGHKVCKNCGYEWKSHIGSTGSAPNNPIK